MSLLRDRLRQSSPKLYEALEKSWEVAWDIWLPAIGPQKGSFNSYPHIRNLEMYLNKLVQAYVSRTGKTNDLLSDLETYIILSCILLHDVGRATSSGFHWEESKKLIEDNWALLGIPCYELALTIGKICAAHDYRKPVEKKFNLDSLTTITVDPYGKIRERELGALLILCDHLDGSIIRVIADFLIKGERESIGAFRSKIRGVDIDLNGGLVKVVLGDQWGDAGDKNGHPYTKKDLQQVEITLNEDYFELIGENAASVSKGLEGYLVETVPDEIREYLGNITLREEKGTYLVDDDSIGKLLVTIPDTIKFGDIYRHIRNSSNPVLLDYLLAFQGIYANKKKQKTDYIDLFRKAGLSDKEVKNERMFRDKSSSLSSKEMAFLTGIFAKRWANRPVKHPDIKGAEPPSSIPYPLILSILLGNTRENVDSLMSITETLQSMGLPIMGWCVEYKGHLYNCLGQETHEPVFSSDFLIATLKAMWELSTRIFGANKLSFEALASHLREPDIVKVKRAVRRLNVISQSVKHDSEEYQAFWISDDYWRWKIKNRKVEEPGSSLSTAHKKNIGCSFYRKKDIEDYLKELGTPNGGSK